MPRPMLLTECSIGRGLGHLMLPVLYATVLQSANGSINSMWVGRYIGEAALTASSSANTIMMLVTGAAYGIVTAATISVGQCIGAGKLSAAKRILATALGFFAAAPIFLAMFGMLLSEPLLRAMNTPAQALPLALSYMRIVLLSLPFIYVYSFITSLLTGVGDSKTPFCFMILSVGIDIILNPMFIFGVGPIPPLGVTGSALASFSAQVITLAALLGHLHRHSHFLWLRKADIPRGVDWRIIESLVRQGVPMGAEVIVISLSGVCMYTLVNRFGVDVAAAYGASFQLWNYVEMPAFAVAAAAATMAAHNVGARRWERVNAITRVGILYSILLTSSAVLVIVVLDRQAYSLFLSPSSNAFEVARHIIRVCAWSTVPLGISVVLFGVMAAHGVVMVPLSINTFVFLIVRVPLAEALLDRWHADAIWWSFPISSLSGLALAWSYYKYGRWRRTRMNTPLPWPER